VTPTSESAIPSAKTISVALGSREQMRMNSSLPEQF
jgi:hypothetical protein